MSPAGTHHVRNGAPIYEERFDEVLKFRAPGLAPVRRGGDAWHIRADGEAAYARRFRRTFGFYEGFAAARGAGGWRHIRPDGGDLYAARYDWCGNFQEGRCAVRAPDGGYLHIDREGEPAYAARWRYAGDFRDGVAAVQSADGRSTHIDRRGRPAHGARFLDLDVFHKGAARARDEDGWTHVNAEGRPLYARRFASVEPFYNGQARVERFDGGVEVIDAAGAAVAAVRPPSKSAFARLSDDLTGFWRTQAICAAVELGVFESLPSGAGEIALSRGLDPDRTMRLLRALAELGLAETTGGEWRATERGSHLTLGHPRTLAGAAREYGRAFSRMWEALPDALRGGGGWRPPDIFADVAADPARAAAHHRMLRSYARHDYAALPAALELRGGEHAIDAGGGLGVLAEALAAAHPDLRVTVLDRPEVVALAERNCAGDRAKFGDRVKFLAADFFDPWNVRGEAVILARVLHDWDDPGAVRILRRARAALRPGGRLFVVETVLPEHGAGGGLCDLHLLAATGGRERTAADYAALFAQSGFVFDGVRRTSALPSVVVGAARRGGYDGRPGDGADEGRGA